MPSIGNRSLCKYEDKFFTTGIGRVSFSAKFHNLAAINRVSDKELGVYVHESASGLAYRISTNAPRRTGALAGGIVPTPSAEKSARPGKVVYDVWMDPQKNDLFVKFTKSGKRYYYPASMEYGFRLDRGRKYTGKYFMKTSSVEYAPEHERRMVEMVNKIVEDI